MKTVWRVTTSSPTTISMQDGNPASLWNLLDKDGSHIPVLTLAWAYILSARWAEIIPGASIGYTDSRAEVGPAEHADTKNCVFDIGTVSESAYRWWSAILATGEGWNACIGQNGKPLSSPWAVKMQWSPGITILQRGAHSQPLQFDPPSYSSALSYILDYVAYHDVHDQSYAAFAAALLLPTRQRISRSVSWRLPRFSSKTRPQQVSKHADPPWGSNIQQLDRLLTMSCNATGVQSLLSSSFIEPDLPCNICGAWLQGAFAVLDSPPAREPPIMARILMQRSPKLDFLWLGAIVMDVHSYIMKWARPAANLIDLPTAGWTDTYISFLQKSVSTHRLNGEILRSDEAKLMFLAQTEFHTTRPLVPLVPFTPFGSTAVKDCVLDVQIHSSCSGSHGLRYAGWSWDCKDNSIRSQNWPPSLLGKGTRADTAAIDGLQIDYSKLDRDMDCSEPMTRSMFNWLRGVDGYPVNEQDIRNHEWIADAMSSDEEIDTPEGDGGSTLGRGVGPWMSKHITT
ncbi:hypothetical protein K4F52_008171 [Lecanicillium sp. MT-2017a]|nr:hypothetical protein K4F52_008171 [Lecanicillium sp. MT-2017a]